MKDKVSITLSLPLLAEIDRNIGEGGSRSAFVEKVLRDYLRDSARQALQMRDMELINAHADELNAEMEDVLRYQSDPLSSEDREDETLPLEQHP